MNGITPGSHWAQIEERGVYAGLRTMLFVYRVIGRRGFSVLLYFVVGYFFLTGRKARHASLAFLRQAYADPRGASSLGARRPGWRQSYRHFRAFGDAVVDKFAAWTGNIDLDDIDYDNLECFEAVHRTGSGGMLIASHLGNMEVCRALGQLSVGLKLNVLVHTKHASHFNRLLQETSPEASVSLIQTTEVGPATAMRLNACVARGEFVVIVGDRTPVTGTGRTSWAPFFGRSAPFPQGPYILASLFGCPVQLIFCVKHAGRYRITFEPFADAITLPRADRQAELDRLAVRYAGRLEACCAKYPYQWFNFFDFWSQSDKIRNASSHNS
jgi:predicted LPLAT superfamily acyltransferase